MTPLLAAAMLVVQAGAAAAPKAPPRIEYRLVALPGRGGESFSWPDGGDKVVLEGTPFLVPAALKSVHVEHDPRSQFYEVRWRHVEADERSFGGEADKQRARTYCILLDHELQECRDFPRRPKDFDPSGESISFFYAKRAQDHAQAQAEALADRLRSLLRR